MNQVWEEAHLALCSTAETMKKDADKHRGPPKEFNPRDQVWLETTNITIPAPPGMVKKLQDKRIGPFEVLQKQGASAYKLKLLTSWKISPTFNESLLMAYIPPEANHQQRPPPPPPELVEGAKEYIVNDILDIRRRGNGWQYLVDWQGYPLEERTWEALSRIKNSMELVLRFHQNNPQKPRPAGV
jgi:hypothetical protein